MPSESSGQEGCYLPEAVRRYYLEAMGIQVWEALAHDENRDSLPGIDNRSIDRQWAELEQRVSVCEKCSLHASRTQTVFGVGNRQADLLVIGEAPGRDEDLQGEPFVGAAGQLLTAMLKAIELQREDVYIANILKCRPPNNRDPEPSEITNCNDYLRQQVALLQPKAIFAVGRIAAQSLLNTTRSISALRGQVHSYENVPLVASYHPAYLLRKPTEKRKAWEDLKRLREVLAQCQ